MRPLTRPDKPYTKQEILDRIYQHFFVEGNPCCVNEEGNCVYTGTGCAVGCLLTLEDAIALEGNNPGMETITAIAEDIIDIYTVYFTYEQLDMLQCLQNSHDTKDSDLNNLRAMLEIYGHQV